MYFFDADYADFTQIARIFSLLENKCEENLRKSTDKSA